jgi:hypothetical protein
VLEEGPILRWFVITATFDIVLFQDHLTFSQTGPNMGPVSFSHRASAITAKAGDILNILVCRELRVSCEGAYLVGP